MKLKELAKQIAQYVTSWFKKKNKEQEEQDRQQQLTAYNNYAQYMQPEIQSALAEVFRQTTISNHLCPIRTKSDFLLSDYDFVNNNNNFIIVYHFSWTKANETAIPTTVLHQMKNRMNQAVYSVQQNYNKVFFTLSDWEKELFIYNHQVLYHGFRIIDCKDDEDAVILSVVLN